METIALKDQMNNEEVKENQAQELTALVKLRNGTGACPSVPLNFN